MSRSNETRVSFLHQVFNMNAPVPPAADGQIDALKQPGQFPSGYGSGFSSQAEGSAEQPDISQDSLQSGESRAASHEPIIHSHHVHTTCTAGCHPAFALGPLVWLHQTQKDQWVQPLYRVRATMQSP